MPNIEDCSDEAIEAAEETRRLYARTNAGGPCCHPPLADLATIVDGVMDRLRRESMLRDQANTITTSQQAIEIERLQRAQAATNQRTATAGERAEDQAVRAST